MTELSTEEAAVVQRFEAAADAEESLRERVARAIHATEPCGEWPCEYPEMYRTYADAAIAVMRGEA